MASNKDKTSKTAHVMNLLSRNHGGDSGETAAASEAAAPPAPPAAAPAAPASPILSPLDADAAAASQIKEALEAELSSEAAAAPPAPAPVPVQKTLAEPAPVQEAPKAAEVPAEETPEEDDSVSYINVMQVLVEEKAEKYMEMFGLCCCNKCQADVKAYALNHLPPKYVVMGQREMIPKLTFYEAQNSSDITAQIIKACKIVMSTPHHSRA